MLDPSKLLRNVKLCNFLDNAFLPASDHDSLYVMGINNHLDFLANLNFLIKVPLYIREMYNT